MGRVRTNRSCWWRRVAVLVVCAPTAVLVATLLVSNYRAQVELRRSALNQLHEETDRLATGLGYFLSERANDLRNLAIDPSISAYFQNRALGMSMDYGLKMSLEAVGRELDGFLASRQLGTERIYRWAALADIEGNVLASAGKPHLDDRLELLPRGTDPAAPSVVSMRMPTGPVLTVAIPLLIKNECVGQLRACVDVEVMRSQFMASRGTLVRFVGLADETGRFYAAENKSDIALSASMDKLAALPQGTVCPFEAANSSGITSWNIGVREPVRGSPLFVINAAPALILLGRVAPDRILATGILLAGLALLGGGVVLWTTIRNSSLEARLDESNRRQRDVEESNARLQSEVAERQQAEQQLRLAKEAAEEANRVKSAFLANMSHEIRTPMTAILGFADVLVREDSADLSARERTAAVTAIRSNGEHLIQIINDILDISKIEAGRLTPELIPCQLINLLAELAVSFRARAEAKALHFQISCEGRIPEQIRTDPVRLKQILINLLGNAIKFTERGAVQLKVSLSGVRDVQGGYLEFVVTDTGIGIPPERVSRLCQPFTQLDESTTRKYGGTGLGLAISKRLTEMLGGSIFFQSEVGQGTAVQLSVATGPLVGVRMLERPVVALPESLKAATHEAVSHLDCRILLAEDSPDSQRLLQFVLTKAGAQVDLVDDGRQAVDSALAAAARGAPYDIILMDMQMPIMDGYEATATLRRHGYHGTVIALTAHAMSSDRQTCMAAGCDDYQTKPIQRQGLLAAIHRHLHPTLTAASS